MGRGPGSTYLMAVVGLGAFSIFTVAPPGHAANLRTTPSIALEETWDTNIFNTPSQEQSDFISRATPGLTFSLESERSTVTLSGSVTSEAYADHHDLNTWDATKRAELSAPTLKITPGLSMRAAARYFETNDLSQRNVLALSPIPGLPPIETLVVGRTSVRTYGGSLEATYQVTPNVGLGVGGGGTKTEYLSPTPGLSGSRTVTGNVSGNYRISPRTSSGAFASTGYTTRDDGSTSRSYTGGLSGSFDMTANTRVEARGGMTFLTDTRADGAVDHEQSPYGGLTINYRGRSLSAALAVLYELTGGGSFGQATDRANASLTLTDQVTPKWSWDLAGNYQNERTAGSLATQKVETAGGAAGVRYAAAEWATLRLAGSSFKQWVQGAVGSDIMRSQVFLGLTLTNTYSLY